MTIETKTTIQLSDVKAVEFECRNCHRIYVYPLEVARNPPISCDCVPNSRWMTVGGDMHQRLTNLIGLVQQLSTANNEPFAMRFVVEGISDRASGGKD